MPKGHKSTVGFKGRKDQRRKDAQKRLTVWESLSLEARLAHLNDRGFDAVKQRAKIAKQIEVRDQQEAVQQAKESKPHQRKRRKGKSNAR